MPKQSKKYYGVRVGREGSAVYETWADVISFPGAIHKSFPTREAAEEWVNAVTYSVTRDFLARSDMVANTEDDVGLQKEQDYIPFLPDHSTNWQQPSSPPVNKATLHVPNIVLSYHQQLVFNQVKRGGNVFFTGSAGTGKSLLLRQIIEYSRALAPHGLAITASTGIAAINIGGTTLHSFAGVGLAKEPVEKLSGKVFGQKKLRHVLDRWRNTRTLIVDEISMVDGVFFDKLEELARKFRDDERPFGGIQVIISGDFCQLPPVPDRLNNMPVPVTFAFEAESWNRCVGHPITLVKVFRQKDQKFVDVLNDMRFGKLSTEAVAEFKALRKSVVYDDGIQPTELFPLRHDVDHANNARLESLPGEKHIYTATDRAGLDSNQQPLSPDKAEQLLDRLVAIKNVMLKVGAQVMLVKNLVQGHLVNGSLGKVVDFRTVSDAAQDHTEIAEVDGANPSKSSQPELERKYKSRVWPVVRFSNGRELLCVPTEFQVVNAIGELEASRDQIPLILAWALSIHKSQGQTIERVKVDLGRIFEKGQAYVALSRAMSMDNLQVLNFEPSKVMAHPRVLQWHADMERQQQQEDVWQILEDMNSPEAMEAFFQTDDSE